MPHITSPEQPATQQNLEVVFDETSALVGHESDHAVKRYADVYGSGPDMVDWEHAVEGYSFTAPHGLIADAAPDAVYFLDIGGPVVISVVGAYGIPLQGRTIQVPSYCQYDYPGRAGSDFAKHIITIVEKGDKLEASHAKLLPDISGENGTATVKDTVKEIDHAHKTGADILTERECDALAILVEALGRTGINNIPS